MAHAAAHPRASGRIQRLFPYLLFILFIAPNIALLVLFTYRPLVESIRLSFYDWDLISPQKTWVGFENYTDYFADPTSRYIIRNTLVFTAATVGSTMAIGLGLALLLNLRLRGRNAARTVLFAPYVLGGAAIGIIWLFIFDPRFGLVSALLGRLGLPSPNWYNDPNWAMPMVIIVYTWKNLGYATVIYLAGLQTIPRELYEAARVDGAGPWPRFWHVTLPQLSPMTFFLLVTTMLSSMQAFDIISVMTAGGPLDATKTMVYQVYEEAFVRFRVGDASTVATVLFFILLGVTLLQVRFLERRVNYG
ncbi:carbohydrate ABC transporter permease [Tepidiforma sp.]|uniref:carbohydrate ABC transporter permease n=1 Tax=Tepidiforma sp. TaxID=2682230 RepID=UPI0026162B67|nr:sugar ABC transporter permease [Tepidiforma sp.]MCX7616520.1 sugar ABC transporter permease [Tepidiforma sp.]